MNQAPSESGAREARVLAAYKIMKAVYDRCQLAGQTTEQTHLAIRAAYPWGERRAWPYKAWLQARREFYERHGLPLKERRSIADSLQETDS
ncbi:hypothetical protein G6F31_021401 [Rhizopus arrhizus]|nr:hypothetical protein G6F31_021401 [Rhizopus arrhizus]